MRTFFEYLKEGREAPLFHGTSLVMADDILSHNYIYGRTEQYTSLKDNGQKDYYQGYKEVSGVSLTRSYKIAEYFGKRGVVFELDQRRLSQNYSIIPVNHWATGVLQYIPGKTARTNHNPKDITDNEAEEFLIGSIKNLDKYLARVIIVDEPNWIKLQSSPYSHLKYHPKLFYKGRFVNEDLH
jgi:hypothetical protein